MPELSDNIVFDDILAALLKSQQGQAFILSVDGLVQHVTGEDILKVHVSENIFDACPFLIGLEDTFLAIATGDAPKLELDQLVLGAGDQAQPLRMRVSAYREQGLLLSIEDSATSFESVQAQVQARNELALSNKLLGEARLEAQRANQAKSRFLSTITHELRTPLSIIIGNTELLAAEEAIKSVPDLQQSVQDADDYARYMLNLVGDLLDLAKAEAGRLTISPQPVDLSALMEKLCKNLGDLATNKGLTFTTDLKPTPSCLLDAIKLQQIATNLIFNAIKFTPEQGAIYVSCKADDGFVYLSVKDTGQGMTAEELTNLGKPFVQFESENTSYGAARGTGLGLALVKTLVELHDGTVDFDSEKGVGTKVDVKIKLKKA